MNLGEFQDQRSVVNRSTKGGCWGAIVTLFGILFCLTPGLRAQGVRYDNIVLGPRGGPVASATIAVCAAGASTSSAPCSPLATIYSDEALTQPMANPMQADSLGNYGFWATPGHYIVEIYGTGLTTRTMNVFLPCDPSNCSMSNATFSSITAGTLNLTGALTVNGKSVATEGAASDALLYVSPNGADSNSGLSWGAAKKTLYAAVTAIQQSTPGGGTIYVAAGTPCGGPVSGQGLWLIGAGDSSGAYSSPPSGWIKVTHPMQIVGVGVNGTPVQNASTPVVAATCGSSGNNPPLWITGTNTFEQITINNINFSSAANNALKIGISPNGSRTTSNTTGLRFDGDSFAIQSTSSGLGPAVDIGGGSFWIWFNHCAFAANPTATALSDQHQGIIVNPTSSGQPSGLLFFDHTLIYNGGIHFYGNSSINGGGLDVHDLTTENVTDGSPAVWITTTLGAGAFANYRVVNVTVSDASVNPTPALKVDGGISNPDVTVASELTGDGENVSGPVTILDGLNPQISGNETSPPTVKGEQGFWQGGLWAAHINDGNFSFSPQNQPWENLVSWSPNLPSATGTAWANSTGGSLTQVQAPDGTMNAWELPASPVDGLYFYENNLPVSVGDYVIASGWFKSASGGFAYGEPLILNTNGCGSVSYVPSTGSYGNGFGGRYRGSNWQWSYLVMKIGAASSGCQVNFATRASANEAVFAPVLIHIPASAGLTDADALNIAMGLRSVPSFTTAPIDSTLAGHPFAFGGSGDNHFAILDHTALTANRTYSFPDTNGSICLATTCGAQVGQISVSGATSASHSFGTSYQSPPVCVVSPGSNPGSFTWWVTSSKSSVTVTLSASATITFNFSCFGNPD